MIEMAGTSPAMTKMTHSPACSLRIARKMRGANIVPRAQEARRIFRRADHGAEIHHALREIARALCRSEFRSQCLQFRLRRRQRCFDFIEA
jgi:hypothetical protein